jgi:F0F1-type ATP synthase delta subunit
MKNKSTNEFSEAISLLDSPDGDRFANEFELSLSEAIHKTHGEKYGRVESAVLMNEVEKEELVEYLEKVLKRQIEFQFTVNTDLIGGFTVYVGDWQLDASIAKLMDQMRFDLTR